MTYYNYRAKKGLENTIEDTIEATSKQEAVDKLNALGLIAVHLEEVIQKKTFPSQCARVFGFRKKVSSRDITIFSIQLANLLKSGAPVLRAFRIIAEQVDNAYLRAVITAIATDIESGKSFSAALAVYPHIFPPLYIAIVKVGEVSGTLHASLERLYHFFYNRENVAARIRAALMYPVIMLSIGLATLIFMLTFVMPKLSSLYASVGERLPLLTSLLLSVSDFIVQQWFWLSFVFCVLGVSGISFFKLKREYVSEHLLRIPLYGKFLLKSELYQLCRTFELALKSGLNMLQTLEYTIQVAHNSLIKKELASCLEFVKQGASLGRSLRKSKNIPAFMSNLIIIGEETGRLDEVFLQIANYYENDTEETLKMVVAGLEPAMVLGIGLIMGIVIVAMLLPIMQLSLTIV